MSSLSKKNIAVIGAGAMGGSIAAGLVKSGTVDPAQIMVADPSAAHLEPLAALGIASFEDNRVMLEHKPDLVVLAVKPQILASVLEPLRDILTDCCVISIAAGVALERLEELVPRARVVRVMPNLPVQVLSGASAVCPGSRATADDTELTLELFGALGVAKAMREDQLDVEGAVVGCGPAFFSLLIDALTRAGVEAGLPAKDCRELLLSTMRGVAEQLLQSDEHPRAYMEKVTSPGGTTAAALSCLEPDVMRASSLAVQAALARTRELAGR